MKRIGKFFVTTDVIKDASERFAEVLALMAFVPIRVEHLWMADSFEYVGISKLFDELPPGKDAQFYEITVCTEDQKIYEVKVTKTDDPFMKGILKLSFPVVVEINESAPN